MIESPLFGLTLSILAYMVGLWISRVARTSLANPFIISVVLVVLFLWATGTEYERFYHGGRMLTLFLGPATASLAVSIYRRRGVLRVAVLPIMAGCLAGSVVSLIGVYVGGRLLGLDEMVIVSLMPKSVTTPIAISLAAEKGGLEALATLAVSITGITGSLLYPSLVRWLRLKNAVAVGVAIGTASHAIGTARAVEMGELQGAMGGIAIGVAGVMTTILFLFVSHV